MVRTRKRGRPSLIISMLGRFTEYQGFLCHQERACIALPLPNGTDVGPERPFEELREISIWLYVMKLLTVNVYSLLRLRISRRHFVVVDVATLLHKLERRSRSHSRYERDVPKPRVITRSNEPFPACQYAKCADGSLCVEIYAYPDAWVHLLVSN